jgi:mannose-1-phosphate guanylyltransferase
MHTMTIKIKTAMVISPANNARLINTKNSLIHSDNRLITTIDLEDVMIIDTKDVLMVAKKGDSQKVKELVDSLK